MDDPRVSYVEETFGFMFESGFARKFEELGSPVNDLEFWYRSATVYRKVTSERPILENQRARLVTLIEAVRFDAMRPPPFGEPIVFDLSAYEFSEDLLAYKDRVVAEVLLQESEIRATIDPAPPSPGLLN
jgi:hypothetical protein